MTIRFSLISASCLLAAASAAAGDQTLETQNKQRDKQEFGAHDRPWAKDSLMADRPVLEDGSVTPPGLLQSKACVEQSLLGEPSTARAIHAGVVNVNAALSAIRKEHDRLDEERLKIADMRALSEAAMRRAQEEMAALRVLRDDVASLIDELERKESENISRVVELIENLSAKDAARILAENDARFVVQVLDALDARVTAEILGRMETERAHEIIGLIASRGRPKDNEEIAQSL